MTILPPTSVETACKLQQDINPEQTLVQLHKKIGEVQCGICAFEYDPVTKRYNLVAGQNPGRLCVNQPAPTNSIPSV